MEQIVTQIDGAAVVAAVVALAAVASATIVAMVGIVFGIRVRAKAGKDGMKVQTGEKDSDK